MQQISDEMRHLLTRIDELRSTGAHARATCDGKSVHAINQQLEFVNAKYNNLVQEQREHSRILQQQQASPACAPGISR